MPKKNFKDAPATAFISAAQALEPGGVDTQDTQAPHDVYNTQSTQRTQETHEKSDAIYYRLNLKLKLEYKEHLKHVSWANHTSITQYLNDLIAADMVKTGEDVRNTLAT